MGIQYSPSPVGAGLINKNRIDQELEAVSDLLEEGLSRYTVARDNKMHNNLDIMGNSILNATTIRFIWGKTLEEVLSDIEDKMELVRQFRKDIDRKVKEMQDFVQKLKDFRDQLQKELDE